MKYALNHKSRFADAKWAYFIGFAQMLMLGLLEIVNVIVLITNYTIMDIIMNFLALIIIGDFDNIFVATLSSDGVFQMITSGDGKLERAL